MDPLPPNNLNNHNTRLTTAHVRAHETVTRDIMRQCVEEGCGVELWGRSCSGASEHGTRSLSWASGSRSFCGVFFFFFFSLLGIHCKTLYVNRRNLVGP